MLVYLSIIDRPEDRDKFELIYKKYRYLMYHAAYKLLQNPQDTEDAVHSAFVSIIKHLDKISDVDSPKTRSFVVLISERKAIDLLRTSHRGKLVEFGDAYIGVEIPLPGDYGIADAITRLPVSYREILLLKYDNGFSNKELSQMMRISESGIRKLIGRAKKALLAELDKEGYQI